MAPMKPETIDTLRGLSTSEASVLEGLVGTTSDNREDSGLEPRVYALVRLAALFAVGGSGSSYRASVESGREAGVTPEAAVGVLVAISSLVGLPRTVEAARGLLDALSAAEGGPGPVDRA